MAWELVGEGNGSNIASVAALEETQVAEGQRAKLVCDTYVPIDSWQVDDLRNTLNILGVEELQMNWSENTIQISWRKGFPWAAVIILALVAVIAIALWQFFKDVPMPVTSVAIIGVAILALAVSYSIFKGGNYNGQT
jgi:hypothetical protein